MTDKELCIQLMAATDELLSILQRYATQKVREELAEPEVPEGFTTWAGGEMPIDGGAEVEVILRDGRRNTDDAGCFCWERSDNCPMAIHTPDADVIAYRVVKAGAEPEPAIDIPEGFIAWHGGECPVPKGTMIDVIYRDGAKLCNIPALTKLDSIREATWAFWDNDGATNDIVAYRVVQARSQYKTGFWYPWTGGECPVSEGTTIRYLLRDGTKFTTDAPSNLAWDVDAEDECDGDIVAFKIKRIKED